MRKYILFSVFFTAFAALNSVYAQDDVFGKWKCTNDEGKVNSIVKIFKKEDGEVCGKVVRITKEEDRDKLCTECKGALKDKPIEGLQLMHGLKKEGDHYILNGSKTYITNGSIADIILVYAKTDFNKKNKGITAFVIETKNPGFKVVSKLKKMGFRGSQTTELFFENFKVPAENI